MTIGRKIAVGFGCVVVALISLAGWSIYGVAGIVESAEEVIDGNKLRGEMTQRELDHLNWTCGVNDLLTDANVTTLKVQTDPHKCAFGQWYYGEGRKHAETLVPAIQQDLRDIEECHTMLHESATEIGETFQQADLGLSATLANRKCDHLAWTHRVKDVFLNSGLDKVDVQMDPTKCKLGEWLYSNDVRALRMKDADFDRICASIEAPHKALHESAGKINELLATGDRNDAIEFFREKTAAFADATCARIDEMIRWNDRRVASMEAAQRIYAVKTKPALAKIQHLLSNIRTSVRDNITTDEAMLANAATTRTGVVAVAMAAIIAAVLIAIGIVVTTKRILSRIALTLGDGAAQVNDAASQVASASQQLADGATEQASALEETSASLEEMAAMTRTNAENAKRANELSNEAKVAAVEGDQTMKQLNAAMNGINESSEKVNNIIKVIEEIAFQTNLLALNAAVEAARAGEHGKGFAVVAEEVRNLAKRAAEAARESTSLIQESVVRARQGCDVAGGVGGALATIVSSVGEATQLIDSITQASGEQAKGVDHISSAVSQIDKGTQQTASGTEEAASAAEELAAQAESVKEMVDELRSLIFGRQALQSMAHTAKRQLPSKGRPCETGSKASDKTTAAEHKQNQWKSLDDEDDGWGDVSTPAKSDAAMAEF